ncbi:MAG: Peroxisome chaperone and import receptor [Vezdaea aestivalis]|nr:MAG: Peroxisome chaperone and import receptor [Vezdaea aestivalis]
MLDDFSIRNKQNITEKKTIKSTESTKAANHNQEGAIALEDADEDFTVQLQDGMQELLGELQSSPEMQQHFEGLMKELGEAGLGPDEAGSSSKGKSATVEGSDGAAETEAAFQETIRKTMERLQESGDQATAAAQSEGPDDMLTEMLKQLQGENIEGAGSEEDISKMIMGMMEELTNKDILYEPMKELDQKFPSWIEKNHASVPEADMKRFKDQQCLVADIVGRFEASGYSDENSADREYIVERMQKMQAAGSPPADLVGDMSGAQDALGILDSGCAQQ